MERGGPAAHEAFESDLILERRGYGDPPGGAKSAARCKSAGEVFMITGDGKGTAVAIGKELGILKRRAWEGNAFCGRLAEAEGGEPCRAVRGRRRLCRTAPADKQRIIKLLADAHGGVAACVEVNLSARRHRPHRRTGRLLQSRR